MTQEEIDDLLSTMDHMGGTAMWCSNKGAPGMATTLIAGIMLICEMLRDETVPGSDAHSLAVQMISRSGVGRDAP